MLAGTNYTKKYFKIYFWKFLSYFSNLAALAFVTPRTTHSPTLYGIFAFCMSLNIFFQYADLGFINAAQKYASEYYAQNNRRKEIEITGFCCFMFLAFMLPVTAGMFWLSYNPSIIIKGISSSPEEIKLASKLLFTLACFSPVLIIQRIVQIIFAVRLEDYYPQRISIIFSLIRVLSVFYFFGGTKYMLFEYFLFFNSLSLVSLFISIWIARKKYRYDFLYLLHNFKYTRFLYKKTSALALNSLVLSFSWIIFYELDLIYIGYFLGKEAVAFYAIGFTILMFFRDAFGTFYYPFLVRFNHLIGKGSFTELMELYHTLLKIGAPLVVVPITAMIVLAPAVINSWVGENYKESIIIVQLLVPSFMFGFLTYPASALLNARAELRKMYINAILQPSVFFIGVLFTQHFLGVKAYALFKMIAIYLNACYFLFLTIKYLRLSPLAFFNRYIRNLILPVIITIITGILVSKLMIFKKEMLSLIMSISLYMLVVSISLFIYYFIDKYTKTFIDRTISSLIVKK